MIDQNFNISSKVYIKRNKKLTILSYVNMQGSFHVLVHNNVAEYKLQCLTRPSLIIFTTTF